ncbi:MAG: phosphohistidine phosphatase SixA [Spirochaetota bacterium]|nr:phosphohistidine phosphatase SixA [Spirochaetota bacterium]
MHIYLVRHAEAKNDLEDATRPLSVRGVEEIKMVSEHLKSKNLKVQSIYHSGKLRAQQTAIELSTCVHSENGVHQQNGLNPMDPVEDTVQLIEEQHDDIMLVGHLPFMNTLGSRLTGLHPQDDGLLFTTATVVCLEKTNNNWQLAWRTSPIQLG